jgi:hypothetical protein
MAYRSTTLEVMGLDKSLPIYTKKENKKKGECYFLADGGATQATEMPKGWAKPLRVSRADPMFAGGSV